MYKRWYIFGFLDLIENTSWEMNRGIPLNEKCTTINFMTKPNSSCCIKQYDTPPAKDMFQTEEHKPCLDYSI